LKRAENQTRTLEEQIKLVNVELKEKAAESNQKNMELIGHKEAI